MSAVCHSEPVSFLRLERYLLGELASAEREAVETHLSRCEACRACFDELRASPVELRALPAPVNVVSLPRRGSAALPLMAASGAALALAAAALLVLRPGAHDAHNVEPLASSQSATKGGGIALSLVRERNGDSVAAPDTFAPGDRFEASLTCPPSAQPTHWELYVMQGGKTYFPLPRPEPIACGNHVALPGAFSLDGDEPATVCVVVDAQAALDRNTVARVAHPGESACTVLSRAQRN